MESGGADIVLEADCGASGGDGAVLEAGHVQSGSGVGEANPEVDCVESSGGVETVQEATHDGQDPQPKAWKVACDGVVLYVDEQAVLGMDVTAQDQIAQEQTRAWAPAPWLLQVVELTWHGCRRRLFRWWRCCRQQLI